MIFRNIGIQEPESADNLAAHIRQERILDFISRAERFENLPRVVGNRCGINPMRLEFSKRELQLDELVAAVGSPICAPAEDQQQPIWSHQVGQRPAFAMLIGQRKVRYLLADFWTGAVAVVLGFDELAPVIGSNILSAGSVFADHIVKDCGFGLLFHFSLFALRRDCLFNVGASQRTYVSSFRDKR